MAKVKINKLPKGFELVDGKVKKKALKRDGGMVTGDQADYGLVTTPQDFYGNTNFNNDEDNSVRYSLSSVPREDANIEAEGGETVLTDLNNNNQFGLYDIKGPRHSQGGVPMYLPEQSFVFSDTNEMKFKKDELAEFGIESRKGVTPADISKRYQLNPYYGEINSQYADEISTRSAELMLKKNMYNLSKLAFGQELKKDFEEGVPLAAFPYLQEQGIDPIEFSATVKEQTRQQAELEFISQLPPEEQDKILRLQAMMQQIDNPDAGALNQPTPKEAAVPDSGYNQDLAQLSQENDNLSVTLQDGGETDQDDATNEEIKNGTTFGEYLRRENPDQYFNADNKVRAMFDYRIWNGTEFIESEDYDLETSQPTIAEGTEENIVVTKQEADDVDNNEGAPDVGYQTNPLPKGHEKYEIFQSKLNPTAEERANGVKPWVLTKVYDQAAGKTTYTITKPLTKNKFEDFGDVQFVDIETSADDSGQMDPYTQLEREIIGVYQDGAFGDNVRVREGIYSTSMLSGELQKGEDAEGKEFLNSYGADLSTEQAENDFRLRWQDAIDKYEAKSGKTFDYKMKKSNVKGSDYYNQWLGVQKAMQEVENEFHYKNFGNNGKPRQLFPGRGREGGGYDGKLGMQTFNKSRSYIRTEKPEQDFAEILDERDPKPGTFEMPEQEKPDWWWQDLNNMATQNALENPLFLPNVPKVPNTSIDYVLDDWTGRANMTNAALNTMAKNLRAFGKGKVAGSNLFGKAVNQLAKDVGNVNTNNIKIMNSVALPQAQLNLRTGLANAKAYADEYDKTVTALGRYVDFENWDKQKSNELYNQAITNRANTFNLNQLKDVMKIDPVTGGLITQKDSKDLKPDPNKESDFERRRREYYDALNRDLELFPDDDSDVRDKRVRTLLGDEFVFNSNTSKSRPKTYDEINEEGKTGVNTDEFNNPSVTTNYGQRGTEKKMKKFAYPFYTGKMGM